MLGYGLRCLRNRRSLWGPAALLAALAALPGLLLMTLFAPAATAFLLTADLRVTTALLPGAGGTWRWIVFGLLVVSALWVRLYLLLLWSSDERKEDSLAAAWRGTRALWGRSFVLYAEAQLLIVSLLVVLVALALLAGPDEIGVILIFAAVFTAIAARAAIRVALTLALRAAVLENAAHGAAWTRARSILRERRNDALAAWVALVAAGVTLWIGGRLLTPALQDTALAYGHDSSRTVWHQFAHLLFAIPVEAFLLAFSAGIWTAVYLGGELLIDRRREERSRADPGMLLALGMVALLVLIANGIPTVVERDARAESRERIALISSHEIRPEDALVPEGVPADTVADYDVTAELRGNRLEWATALRWINDTGTVVESLGVHVYANAYTRELDEIPLATDLLQFPAVQARARTGTLEVVAIRSGGRAVDDYSLENTALEIPLHAPVRPGETVTVQIRLASELPRWPERFGTWDDVTLLGNWIPVVALRENGAWRFDEYGSVGDPFVSETAAYRVALSLPGHLGAVGTGALVGMAEDLGVRTWTFDAPAARDAAYAISPFWRGLERRAANLTVRAWYPADKSLDGANLIADGTSAVADFTDRFGPLPFDEVDIVQTHGVFGGMEYPGVVFVSDGRKILEGFPILPDLLEHSGFGRAGRRYVVGHEVAHQWWYASAGNDQVREPWLDEALAEISTRVWLRSEDGDDRVWVMTNLAVAPEPEPGVLSARPDDFDSNAEYSRAVYLGGSEILLRLRARIGAESFDAVMRAWHERTAGRIGSVDEFIETVESIVGADAAAYLRSFR